MMKTHASIKTAAPPGRDASVARHAPQLQRVPGLAAAGAGGAAMTLQRHQEMANQSPHARQLRQQANLLAASVAGAALPQTAPAAQRMEKPNHTGLPDRLKTGVESLSGMSMDHVRVHYNSDKPAQLQAHAYAQGRDIHLAPGQERHLPHEAWHIVQQAQGRVRPTLQMKGGIAVNDDAGLEREADRMGAQADGLGGAPLQARHAGYPAAPVVAPVMQRVILSKLRLNGENQVNNAGTFDVQEVIIAGRTPSPYTSTMGAHSTAWVAHIDQLRRTMVNLPLMDAAREMMVLAIDELDVAIDLKKKKGNKPTALYHLKHKLSTKHQQLLVAARGELETDKGNMRALIAVAPSNLISETDAITASAALQKLINSYLTFINYLPGSTVDGGDPSGHGEAAARSDLSGAEYVLTHLSRNKAIDKFKNPAKNGLKNNNIDDEIKTLPNNVINSLIKKGAFQTAKPSGKLIALLISSLWTLFAVETPTVFLQQTTKMEDRLIVWRLMLKKFLATIRAAYPYTFNLTRMYNPAQQRQGLMGLTMHNALPSDPCIEALLSDKKENWLNSKATVRNTALPAGVTSSDLKQAGTGFQATVLLRTGIDGTPVVAAVSAVGRTMSPFSGTMGAHTTAWTVHVDAVRRLLRDQPLLTAIEMLRDKARNAIADESLVLANLLDEKQKVHLIDAWELLQDSLATNLHLSPVTTLTIYLEGLIAAYLNYINSLPLSTVQKGGVPGGRNEGRHRTYLNNHEAIAEKTLSMSISNNERKVLEDHLKGMYDGTATSFFLEEAQDWVHKNLGKNVTGLSAKFGPGHPLHDYINSPTRLLDDNDITAMVVKRFRDTVREAYPHASKDGGIDTLFATHDAATVDDTDEDYVPGKKSKGKRLASTNKSNKHIDKKVKLK